MHTRQAAEQQRLLPHSRFSLKASDSEVSRDLQLLFDLTPTQALSLIRETKQDSHETIPRRKVTLTQRRRTRKVKKIEGFEGVLGLASLVSEGETWVPKKGNWEDGGKNEEGGKREDSGKGLHTLTGLQVDYFHSLQVAYKPTRFTSERGYLLSDCFAHVSFPLCWDPHSPVPPLSATHVTIATYIRRDLSRPSAGPTPAN